MTPSSWLKMKKITCYDVTIDGGIAHNLMNRPDKKHAMIRELRKALPDIIKEIEKNSEARVNVLSGQGKHFSAGMDLSTFVPP